MKFPITARRFPKLLVAFFNRGVFCLSTFVRDLSPTLLPLPGRYRSSSGAFKCTENGKVFITYRIRPVFAQKVDPLQVFEENSDTAIVIQGPIVKKFSFTLETVKLYGQIFPGSSIIVSTWRHEPIEHLEALEKLGVHVIATEVPPKGGIGSHNLQMTSSNAGATRAHSIGAEFVMKTRSDQRIYNPNAIRLMKGLLEHFPLSEGSSTNQDARLAVISFSSFVYRLFGLSDMLHFGKSADVLKYWNGSLDDRVDSDNLPTFDSSIIDMAKRNIAETYFMTNFLNSTGWDLKWTLENYWKACMERFVIVDAASLDLYWPKYSIQEDRWKHYRYPITHQEMDFAFWIGIRKKVYYDKFLLDAPERELGFPLAWETDISQYRETF